MIKSFFKIARRNVIRHKAHTAINVTGLALGMTCCLFIFLWVQDEKGIDNFHSKGKNLYALYNTVTANGKSDGNYNTPYNYKMRYDFVIEDIKDAVPEVKHLSFYATGYDLP